MVLVTGGTRGIGAAIAAAFDAEGETVVVCGRHRPDVVTGSFVACDVGHPEEVDALVATILERHGRLDVLINNAGGSGWAEASRISLESFARVIELNLLAPFSLAQRANTVMQTQDEGGVIVNVGSTAAIRPAPGMAAYSAAKAALSNLTRTLAIEWAPKVRVNCVAPGPVATERAATMYEPVDAVAATIPVGRLAEPADVATACLLLADRRASYITGAELVVDGGGERPALLQAILEHRGAASSK